MRIGELAKRAEVSKDTIRHYLDLGLLRAEKNPDNGYQIFTSATLQRLHFIRTARQLGFHLEDIQRIFQEADKGRWPCPDVRGAIVQRISETRQKLVDLEQLCQRMATAVAEWDTMPLGHPDGNSVCRLIESQEPQCHALQETAAAKLK